MKIAPKNWRDFQHYKDRNPPWIRLHKSLLDNYEFQCLPVASRALAPMLWLLASDSVDGVIDADEAKLAFRLRMSIDEVSAALKPLIDNGFFDVASGALAERKQVAVPETETEALQRQKEKRPRKARATPLPEGFGPSTRVNLWAIEKGYSGHMDAHLEAFVSYVKRSGKQYVDWDEAFMTAIREDWGKVRAPRPQDMARTTVPADPSSFNRTREAPMTPEQREAADKARKLAMSALKVVAK
jgi:hypothetical protein